MKLAHFFIDHPRFATVMNVFIVLFGLAASTFLPVAQYPAIVPPTIQITTSYPGASADTVARTVATPLEQAVNGVENMDYITSQSTGNGLLTITVIFKIGTDPNTALLLTQSRLQDTLSRLPANSLTSSSNQTVKGGLPVFVTLVASSWVPWTMAPSPTRIAMFQLPGGSLQRLARTWFRSSMRSGTRWRSSRSISRPGSTI